MEAFNTTPFSFAYIPGRIGYPEHSLTVIVKGTFTMRHGEVVELESEQAFPTGDTCHEDDPEGTGSLYYENDFAPFKPRADLLLVGQCHPPGDRATSLCTASFTVGKHGKRLAVIGDRHWRGMMKGWSDPQPFASMPLRWERSFGSPENKRNPIGVGQDKIVASDGKKVHPLPNLENPDKLIRSKSDRPEPAGFGPLNRMWDERFSRVGTYKGKWLDTRFPAVPEDFDWRFYNAAPPDMQVDGYLTGDEIVRLENLRSDHTTFEITLPGDRVSVFLAEDEAEPDSSAEPNKLRVRAVPMNLDTLWVDADTLTLVLVWRGVVPVRSESMDEIRHLLIASQPLSDPVPEVADGRSLLDQAIRDYREQWGMDDAEMPPDSSLDLPGSDDSVVDEKLTLEPDPELLDPLNREEIERCIASGESITRKDLSGLDLNGLQAAGVDFSGSRFSDTDLTGARLTGALMSDCRLDGADLTDADLSGTVLAASSARRICLAKAVLNDADLNACDLTEAILSDAQAVDAVFDKACLARSNLRGLQATGATFDQAILDEASAEGASFERADLGGASLCSTNLTGASLVDTNLAGSKLTEATLDRARVDRVRATEGCDLSRASLKEVTGTESLWQGAVLHGAVLSHADLEAADFSDAVLEGAILDGANLPMTRFVGAKLRGASLRSVNLFRGSMEKADLTDANLSRSNMFEVEFLDATFSNTVGEQANLKRTKQYKG